MSDVPLITGSASLDFLTEAGLDPTSELTEDNRPMFWQQLERIRQALVICDTLAPLRMARVTLTDAQIKALPTTPITIVPAPGSGSRIKLISADLDLSAAAGAYTNVNAAGWMGLRIGSFDASAYVANDGVNAEFTALLTNASRNLAHLGEAFAPDPTDFGALAGVDVATSQVNAALTVFADNSGGGNLTGGNAANTLTITVVYLRIG